MISLINHDFQWGRSEVVIIYPDLCVINTSEIGEKLSSPAMASDPPSRKWRGEARWGGPGRKNV